MRKIVLPRQWLKTNALLIHIASGLLAANLVCAGPQGWSGSAGISPGLEPDPTRGSQLNDLAVNGGGLALAAWDQFTYSGNGGASIGVAVRSTTGWEAPFTISDTSGFAMAPKAAVGADGTMAVSWVSQDPVSSPAPQQRIQVAVKPAGAAGWTTTTLAQGTLGGVAITQFAPVGIDGQGNVTACWTLWDGTRHVVQAATTLAGAGWSTPVDLAPGIDGLYANLAVNTQGDAGVVFSISPYSSSAETAALYVFRSGPSGTWTTPVTVSEAIPATVGYITRPQVALDANGLATVIYVGYGVEGTRQLDAGIWTTPQTILPAPTAAASFTSFDLGCDATGNAVVAASIFDASIGINRASIWAAIGNPSGIWTTPQRLTNPAAQDAYAARAAVSPDGALVLAGWVDHYTASVQISRLENGIWSDATTIGRGTAWASFQEVLALEAGSSTFAQAIWKNTRHGTKISAATYAQ